MAGETMAEELGVMLERSLKWQKVGPGSALDLSALKIVSGKRCWVLQVDGLVLSTDGNLLGALSIATKAALADLKIPKIDVTMGEDGDDPELDLDDDPELAASIDTSRIPIFVSVAQGGLANVVDLTGDEELACPNAAHIAINTKGSVCNVTKTGSEPLAPGRLLDMIDAARGLAPEVHRAMNNYFESMQ